MRTVSTSARTYDIVGSGDALRTQALVLAALADPALSTGIGSRQARVEVLDPFLYAHVTREVIVLTGRPELALPTLATADAFVHLRIRATGLPPQDVTVRVPMGSALPYSAPDVLLTTPAIALAGRVTAAAFPHAAVPGAAVEVTGPVPGGNLLGLRSALARPHDEGTPVREVPLNLLVTTTLAEPAPAGTVGVFVTSTASISPGRVLGLGPVERLEHAVVASVDTASSLVQLNTPLVRTWPPGTSLAVSSIGAAVNPTTLGRAALAGDAVLVTAAPSTAAFVEIADAVPADVEYRSTGVLGDADGYWRQDGVRGLPAVQLRVTHAGFQTAGPTSYPLDPARDPNVIDTELTV